MNYKFLFLIFVMVGLPFSGVIAQSEKNEVEDTIDREEMPEKALETLSEFWPASYDIRYYFQTDGDSESYEAKLEWQGRKFSIEFSLDGRVLNVEVLIERDEISPEAKEGIENYLQQEFRRVKVTRLQRQFIADDEDDSDDEDFIDDVLEGDDDDYLIRYEIEVEGRSGGEIGAFELLFDQSGDLIQRRKIVRSSIDNIW